MVSRAVIDQAIGVAITHGSLLPDQGWGVLRTVSQTTNIKVRLIAEQIVRWPHSGRLPEDIRQVLEAALAHLRDSGPPAPHRPAARAQAPSPQRDERDGRRSTVPVTVRGSVLTGDRTLAVVTGRHAHDPLEGDAEGTF
ncbi:ANTAR domain-containing protein [Streptomyces sp. AgN23]|uniref:ANTAR domain-containing protein n=1 Tax=Streptomyces sp. AgN23 TaxID=1188315 RepID=UPI001FF6A857|nr:ANTAR domain-containing protein [Streptomyces sp. AgN23]